MTHFSDDVHEDVESSSVAATVAVWIGQVVPPPPPALKARVTALLAPYADRDVDALPEACLAAGEQLLDELLASGSRSRESALDLLAVDSLITYAFEIASSDPSRFEARAALAMKRIATRPMDRHEPSEHSRPAGGSEP